MHNTYNSWRSGIQIDNIYPIGSIYMSVNNTDPGTLFGGTWQAIENTFLVAQGSNFTAGSNGGQISINHTHQYGMQFGGWCGETIFEGDTNTGSLKYNTDGTFTLAPWSGNVLSADAPVNATLTSTSTTAHNMYHQRSIGDTSYVSISTLPPYLAVYMWKRIA